MVKTIQIKIEKYLNLNQGDNSLNYGLPCENTFRTEYASPWVVRHRTTILFFIFASLSLSVYAFKWDFRAYSDSDLDRLAVTVGLGDLRSIRKIVKPTSKVQIDEIFGNQYVKDQDNKIQEDPRVAYAVNPIINGATMPVDLSPHIQPKYSAKARMAGVEGTLMLEIIVADDGDVLRVKPVGKQLGYGLEKMAVLAFKQKLYKPSINPDGDAIIGKFYQPVRFQLD